jgi:acyl dehydratase
MSEAPAEAKPQPPVSGKITPEGVAKMRERIGVLVPQTAPFNFEASTDAMRHFANGYGDENPLYCDPSYAKGTSWGAQIATPLFLMTMGVSEISRIRPEVRARGAHALAGVHEFYSGDEWEWFLPVSRGDTMTKRYYVSSVDEKSNSKMGGGKSVIVHYRGDYINQRGQLVATSRFRFVRVERDAARKAGKYTALERPKYTQEDLDRIDATYQNQPAPRGADDRYWEDVEVGEELPTLAKGPLTVTDIVTWVAGWGAGVSHSRLAWKHRKKRPGFFTRNEYGAWDMVERVHWDETTARMVGNPAPYDFGRMRSAFLTQVVTNWMGDNAWLWRLKTDFRQFNFIGDMTWVKGRVADKAIEGDHHVVDLELACENQRGDNSARGFARVIVPSRASGPVKLPKPNPKDDVPLIY